MLRLLLATAALLVALAAPASAQDGRVVLAFLPAGGQDDPGPVLERLESRPQLAIGLLSATQGVYSRDQTVLDMSQGARTSAAAYSPEDAPELELVVGGDGSGFMFRFSQAVRRAETALADIVPGLLASQLPAGAGYAGVEGRAHVEATVAADRGGDVATVALGPAAELPVRVATLLARHDLVVAGLPTGAKGNAALDTLIRRRSDGDLLIVVQTPPRAQVPQLLPVGVAGLDGTGSLTSVTTRLDGVVAGIDVTATVLRHVGAEVPRAVAGQALRSTGGRDAAALEALRDRLRVVSGRRVPVLQALLFSWLALTFVLGLVADRRGVRAALRVGALAVLWVLPVLLLTAALAPGAGAEIAIVIVATLGLAALTDRFVLWPRGPVVPALATVGTYAVDLAFGSPLIIRSLLGPNPRSGSRFYGLGNELEATLPVILLVGLAALLHGRGRSRPAAALVAGAMATLAVFVASGALGAAVGGVITVGVGAAVATLLLLPGRTTRRRLAYAAAVPVVGLAALAAVDIATGGNGHFSRTVLDAEGGSALTDTVVRRYTLAFNTLVNGAMPFLTALALLAVAYAYRYRDRIYAPLRGSPSWRAGLIGGFAAALAGALANDSGPVLLVFGVFVLACATAYVRGDPALAREGEDVARTL
jgi:hypothetical protein